MNLLIAPFVNALFWFNGLTGNLGWAVVGVTVVIKILMWPLMAPSLRSAGKMKELQPRLKKLQEKYGKDRQGLAKAQMDFYKQEGINPASGCLPQILQIAVLLLFFSAFNMVSGYSEGKGNFEEINKQLIPALAIKQDFRFNTRFIGSDLTKTPAKIIKEESGKAMVLPLILLLGSGLLQYLSSKLMMPGSSSPSRATAGKPSEKKGDNEDIMEVMRVQSTYMMPVMTVVIGWNFSVGLSLYWFVNSLTMLVQQVMVK
jgi:YidC/Oxa1 family membrane protein insertase